MKRSIRPLGLLLASVSAILGSGWLFAVFFTSTYAGPSALIAWVIGGAMMILIAFVFAELTAMLPIVGSSTRIPYFTHGSLTCFVFAWIIWLSYASLVATEVQAVLQYSNYFFPYLVLSSGGLTHLGYACAVALLFAVSALNIYSVRGLVRCNNFMTFFKIAIPLLIAVSILISFYSTKHMIHAAHSVFMPYGWHGVVAAISTGGIVFAFNGFKQACELAGEAKRPAVALPGAIIGSICVTLVIYLLLQAGLLVSLTPSNLVSGWHHIHLSSDSSPLSAILVQDHLRFLMPVLYIGAIVGPLAAALMFMSSASRSLYGMGESGYVPSFFCQVSGQGNPIVGIVTTFIFALFLFAPLPGWRNMVTFLTALMSLTYGIAPVCLLALRRQVPLQRRPFRLAGALPIASLAFYICTLLTYWTGWAILSKLSVALLVGLIVFSFSVWHMRHTEKRFTLDGRASLWLWFYLIGVAVISYAGNFGGGHHLLSPWQVYVSLGVLCVLTLWLALRFMLPGQVTQQLIVQLTLPKGEPVQA